MFEIFYAIPIRYNKYELNSSLILSYRTSWIFINSWDITLQVQVGNIIIKKDLSNLKQQKTLNTKVIIPVQIYYGLCGKYGLYNIYPLVELLLAVSIYYLS